MCRFLIYKGADPIRLSNLLTKPQHSIINQSFDSRLRLDRRRPINGDGFGLAYYPTEEPSISIKRHHSDEILDKILNKEDSEKESLWSENLNKEVEREEQEVGPSIFKAITPAWNNENLRILAERTKSKLMFAHVRASTYGVLSETNCHPFNYHSITFMHNGGVANFKKVRRRFLNELDDEFFNIVQGSTDSECCFALFVHILHSYGYDPSRSKGKFGSKVLRKVMNETISRIKYWTKEANKIVAEEKFKLENDQEFKRKLSLTKIKEIQESKEEPSMLNFAVTDGESIIVSRYISSKVDEAPSLYFSCGSDFVERKQGEFNMHRVDKKNKMVLVSSEPITFERNDWTAIPTNSLLTILKDQTILLHPIIDEYYQKNPLFIRDSGFSTRKGQMGYIPKDDIVNADGKVIKDNSSDINKYSAHVRFPAIPPLDSERRDHLI
ncbi:related to Probable glutamine amidotransferase DUG3 [Hanseniaspora guilliermondii]|uniref:Related to Probable glutamine amidotransferase DUG3 n=1 Tax=Hanseniaspora guilliermondii TaxID=56406 RepID=A0A1L0FNS8_9ASCO|nr:related to Probable glutamine amidotransferase DUG3 [Hanseniaspora guilliermondii]